MDKTTNGEERMVISERLLLLMFLLMISVLLITSGCSKKKYREKADVEVYDLLNTVDECDPLWNMQNFTLNANEASRYGNFYDPDNQPMPEDDPTAYRLMQCIDGKRGGKGWLKNGMTDQVDNANWITSLPVPVDGKIIIDKETAIRLALLHSPNYRTALENVYMSALTVTGERFAFDVQFYGGESLFYNNRGGFRNDSTSTLRNEVGNFGGFMTKKFATGSELVVSMANSLVWTFSPSGGSFSPTTTIGYSFTQPLLRGAGRAIVLEDLTRTERQLLGTVRQFAFYQQGFYVSVLTGSTPVTMPSRSGYAGFGVSTPSSQSSGFYGLLLAQVQIRNQVSNVRSLQDNTNRYEEYFKAGQVEDRYDVDRVRQNLLNGQSSLISSKNSYKNNVDSFLVSLGLPPNIEDVVIQDPMLDQFVLMPITLQKTSEEVEKLLAQLRDKQKSLPENPKEILSVLKEGVITGEREIVAEIDQLMGGTLLTRRKGFEALMTRLQNDHPEVDSSFCDPKLLDKRVQLIQGDYDRQGRELDDFGNQRKRGVKFIVGDIFKLMELTLGKYDAPTLTRMLKETRANPVQSPFSQEVVDLVYELQLEPLLIGSDSINFEQSVSGKSSQQTQNGDQATEQDVVNEYSAEIEKETNQYLLSLDAKDDIYRIWFRECLARFDEELMNLRLIQARARLEAISLSAIDIDSIDAFQVASEYRLDWMNSRSNLVDQWRNIEIVANRLKGVLSLTVAGDISNEGSNPVNFSAKEANFRAGVKFDAPLARLIERNEYRRALISYDQARRTYYTYVDNIDSQLRNVIRTIRFDQVNFELQRENVLVAIQRVQQAQLKLIKPPTESRIGTISSTAAQNLVDALRDLLDTQNSLVQNWLQYQVRRMGLLLALGVFEIDAEGQWVDPGDINKAFLQQYLGEIGQYQDVLAGLPNLPTTEELSGGRSIEELQRAIEESTQETMGTTNPRGLSSPPPQGMGVSQSAGSPQRLTSAQTIIATLE